MRRAAKVDANQTEIVSALRKAGATVRSTASLGQGFPDIAVGFRGKNYLLEIKDGSKPPSERKLTPKEKKFFDEWRGFVVVVTSSDEALSVIGSIN